MFNAGEIVIKQGAIGGIVGTVDCLCEFLQFAQRTCEQGLDPFTVPQFTISFADCIWDRMIRAGTPIEQIESRLAELYLWWLGDEIMVKAQPPGCGKHCHEACADWWHGN